MSVEADTIKEGPVTMYGGYQKQQCKEIILSATPISNVSLYMQGSKAWHHQIKMDKPF